jgi:hypothetical protein
MSLRYEIRIRGRVGEELADVLDLVLTIEPAETVLRAAEPGLRNVLAELDAQGVEVVEVRRLPAADT